MTLSDLFRFLIWSYTWPARTFLPSGRAFPPLYYGLEITRRCNLRCKMCQNLNWLNNNPYSEQCKDELSTEDWFKVLDNLHWFNIASFLGGEPFIRKDFLQLLAYASNRCRTHFITNGQLITKSHIEEIVRYAPKRMTGRGLIFVGISIDGPEEVHDNIRGQKGAFNKAVEAAYYLRKAREARGKRAPRIHITTVLQSDNVDFLHEMPAIAKRAGADVFNVTIENRTNPLESAMLTIQDPYSIRDFSFPEIPKHRLEIALSETRHAARIADIELRLPNMPIACIVEHYAKNFYPENFTCYEPWTCLRIAYNGNVGSCHLAIAGNVQESSLKTLWNNSKTRAFRKRIRRKLPLACAGCCSLSYCANKCRASQP